MNIEQIHYIDWNEYSSIGREIYKEYIRNPTVAAQNLTPEEISFAERVHNNSLVFSDLVRREAYKSDLHRFVLQDVESSIQNADVFIYGGGESDAWMKDVLSTLDTSRTLVLSMTDLVPLLETHSDHDHGETEYDEHVWTSPDNALLLVAAIRDAIITADPDNALLYTANAENYMAEITSLREDCRTAVSEGNRDILVFADRYPFLYFSECFDLRYFSPFAGCAHETEPGAQTVAELIQLVKAETIPVVFYIEFSNQRLANTVAEATGCETLLFHS
jgi:zinc transport system substrate-binding protein